MIGRRTLQTILATACLLIPAATQAGPPEDAASYHLVTVTHSPPTDNGRRLLHELETHPQLAQIAAACKRFAWTTRDPIYRARYAAELPHNSLPLVALVRSDGGVIYKASGRDIPPADELAAALAGRAYLDRKANPRPIPRVEYTATQEAPDRFGEQQTGPWYAGRRPILDRVIPDSVTVEPRLQVSDKVGYAVATVFALVILCCGILAFAAVAVGLVLYSRRG